MSALGLPMHMGSVYTWKHTQAHTTHKEKIKTVLNITQHRLIKYSCTFVCVFVFGFWDNLVGELLLAQNLLYRPAGLQLVAVHLPLTPKC